MIPSVEYVYDYESVGTRDFKPELLFIVYIYIFFLNVKKLRHSALGITSDT